jgi:hypothetical protein
MQGFIQRPVRPGVSSNPLPTILIAILITMSSLAGGLVWPGNAAGERIEAEDLMPWFGGGLLPDKLPRSHRSPVELLLDYTPEIKRAELQSFSLELSRTIAIHTEGLRGCPISDLYLSAKAAKRMCAGSLVGHGAVTSEVPIPGQPAGPVKRGLLAFYSQTGRQRYILAQVTSGPPHPLTYVIPFRLKSPSSEGFGLRLEVAHMSEVRGEVRYGPRLEGVYSKISELDLSLKRAFKYKGRRVGFLSADCPAPRGYSGVTYLLMKVRLTYTVAGGAPQSRSLALTRSCRVAR